MPALVPRGTAESWTLRKEQLTGWREIAKVTEQTPPVRYDATVPRSLAMSWGTCPVLWWLGNICMFLPVLVAGAVLRLALITAVLGLTRNPDTVVNTLQICGQVSTSTQPTHGSTWSLIGMVLFSAPDVQSPRLPLPGGPGMSFRPGKTKTKSNKNKQTNQTKTNHKAKQNKVPWGTVMNQLYWKQESTFMCYNIIHYKYLVQLQTLIPT